MKLINQTDWDSKDLRKLVLENIKRAGLTAENYVVRIINARTGATHRIRYTGMARLNRKWFMIGIPKWKEALGDDGRYHRLVNDEFDPVRFSQVTQHELDHNRGLMHADMPYSSELDCDWASGFEVRKAVKKPVKVKDLKAVRYAQTLEMIKKKQTIIKRNENLLKKYLRKKKYYEKQGVGVE